MKTCPVALLCAAALSLASCASAPDPAKIPADMSSRELIQRAQEASDASNWKAARVWYSVAKERYSSDLSVVCACEYELAFIDWKAGRSKEAKAGFEALLARYRSPDAALLPQEYKYLSELILAKVDAKLAKKPSAK